jgi:hypothetical protein
MNFSKAKKNIIFSVKNIVGAYPSVSWILKLMPKFKNGVTKETDIVIAGFPRSGNSFFYEYTKLKNLNIKVVHHNHLPFVIRDAVKKNVPVVFLLRDPVDTITSLLIADPNLSVDVGVKNYAMYLKRCLVYKNQVVVAVFPEQVHSPAVVIEKVNKKYGVGFSPGNLSEDDKAVIFGVFKENTRKRGRLKNLYAAPSQEKEGLKEKFRKDVESSKYLEHCIELFEEWVS